MGFLAPLLDPNQTWIVVQGQADIPEFRPVGRVIEIDQARFDALKQYLGVHTGRSSALKDLQTGLVLGGSLLLVGTGNPLPLLSVLTYTASQAAASDVPLPTLSNQVIASLTSSFSTPLGPILDIPNTAAPDGLDIPNTAAPGGLTPFGTDDQIFLANAAQLADQQHTGHPPLLSDTVVLLVALLLLALAWRYVRKK